MGLNKGIYSFRTLRPIFYGLVILKGVSSEPNEPPWLQACCCTGLDRHRDRHTEGQVYMRLDEHEDGHASIGLDGIVLGMQGARRA